MSLADADPTKAMFGFDEAFARHGYQIVGTVVQLPVA
jgi:hypothetical protein